MHYIYILECNDGSLYTGYTTDLKKRVMKHNQGKASKYTRSRLPVHCIYTEEYPSKSEALKREQEIKKLSRPQKLAIILNR
ncbi:MAG TPA: endonuclease [Syntrophomonas sp.]|jgi:putative endonuclease|nr:endonuclease [Syntrophomonas sp.]